MFPEVVRVLTHARRPRRSALGHRHPPHPGHAPGHGRGRCGRRRLWGGPHGQAIGRGLCRAALERGCPVRAFRDYQWIYHFGPTLGARPTKQLRGSVRPAAGPRPARCRWRATIQRGDGHSTEGGSSLRGRKPGRTWPGMAGRPGISAAPTLRESADGMGSEELTHNSRPSTTGTAGGEKTVPREPPPTGTSGRMSHIHMTSANWVVIAVSDRAPDAPATPFHGSWFEGTPLAAGAG